MDTETDTHPGDRVKAEADIRVVGPQGTPMTASDRQKLGDARGRAAPGPQE